MNGINYCKRPLIIHLRFTLFTMTTIIIGIMLPYSYYIFDSAQFLTCINVTICLGRYHASSPYFSGKVI